jgi:hypothetical protein
MLTVAGASYPWRERFIWSFEHQLSKTAKILYFFMYRKFKLRTEYPIKWLKYSQCEICRPKRLQKLK